MTTMTDVVANWLLVGGMLGAFLRVLLSDSETWRRSTILHAIMGGFTAVLLPWLFKVLPPLAGMTPVEIVGPPTFLVSFGVVMGGFGNYALVALLWRFGVFKNDPRADKPDNGDVKPDDGGGT